MQEAGREHNQYDGDVHERNTKGKLIDLARTMGAILRGALFDIWSAFEPYEHLV